MSNQNEQLITRILEKLEKPVTLENLASLIAAKAKVFPDDVTIKDSNGGVQLSFAQKIKSNADASPKL
uniref:Uncharacterized protein n=1 Tax=Glossina morsitans morsitans TaxID=37546 RepID=A0A1B0G251_GLOMM